LVDYLSKEFEQTKTLLEFRNLGLTSTLTKKNMSFLAKLEFRISHLMGARLKGFSTRIALSLKLIVVCGCDLLLNQA
jgi:hypothetical protein